MDGAENIATEPPKHPLILNETSDMGAEGTCEAKIGLNFSSFAK